MSDYPATVRRHSVLRRVSTEQLATEQAEAALLADVVHPQAARLAEAIAHLSSEAAPAVSLDGPRVVVTDPRTGPRYSLPDPDPLAGVRAIAAKYLPEDPR